MVTALFDKLKICGAILKLKLYPNRNSYTVMEELKMNLYPVKVNLTVFLCSLYTPENCR